MRNADRKTDRRLIHNEGGQAIAEFALTLPLLLLLILAIIQISLMFVAQNVVDYAAFAAARAELVGENPQQAAEFVCSAISGPAITAGVGHEITVPGWGVLPKSRSASQKTFVNVTEPLSDESGQITVTVTHYYQLIVPVASLIFKPISRVAEPGDVPEDIFILQNGEPHLVITTTHVRPVPWQIEMQGVSGHPDIP